MQQNQQSNESHGNEMYKKTKKAFIFFFGLVAVIFIGVGITIFYLTKDPFDYSKYDASSIAQKLENPWFELKAVDRLDISQSKIVIYWNQHNKTKISCKNENCNKTDDNGKCVENKRQIKGDTLFIKESSCYMSLPKHRINIDSLQSKVILIRPSEQVTINSMQSKILVDDSFNRYNYKLSFSDSDMEGLVANPNGITIRGNIKQSDISTYSY